MRLDDLVDQPVLDRLVGLHVAVAVHVVVDLPERLAGVLGEDLVEPLADLGDLPGVNWMARGWPLKPAEGWVIRNREFGSDIRLPFAPPVRITAPIDIAMPTQIVCTSGLTHCIMS